MIETELQFDIRARGSVMIHHQYLHQMPIDIRGFLASLVHQKGLEGLCTVSINVQSHFEHLDFLSVSI